jgi:hypothetical protein
LLEPPKAHDDLAVATRSTVIARSSWAFGGSPTTYIIAYIHINGA